MLDITTVMDDGLDDCSGTSYDLWRFVLSETFYEQEIHWPPHGLAGTSREIYEIRKFRLTFCLETMEKTRAEFTSPEARGLQHRERWRKVLMMFCLHCGFFPHTLARYDRLVGLRTGNYRPSPVSNYTRTPRLLMYNKQQCKTVLEANGYG